MTSEDTLNWLLNPKALTFVCVQVCVCVEKLAGLSSPAAIVTVKLKNMAPVLEKFGCFNSSLVSTNSISAICILGARGQLLLIIQGGVWFLFVFFAQPLNDLTALITRGRKYFSSYSYSRMVLQRLEICSLLQ